MKRFPLFGVLLFAGCTDAFAFQAAPRIVGEWVVVDFHSPGAVEDRSQLRKRASISEETWSEQFQGDQFEDFEYTIDATRTPKQLDLIYTGPDGKRLTVRAIYEQTEDDRLRVCLGSPPLVRRNGKVESVESVRPVAFEAKDGPLITYQRKTK